MHLPDEPFTTRRKVIPVVLKNMFPEESCVCQIITQGIIPINLHNFLKKYNFTFLSLTCLYFVSAEVITVNYVDMNDNQWDRSSS